MHDRPICFSCHKTIERNSDMVFESLCGCDAHPSAVFHAICLFDWRDKRRSIEEHIRSLREAWIAEHGDPNDGPD